MCCANRGHLSFSGAATPRGTLPAAQGCWTPVCLSDQLSKCCLNTSWVLGIVLGAGMGMREELVYIVGDGPESLAPECSQSLAPVVGAEARQFLLPSLLPSVKG